MTGACCCPCWHSVSAQASSANTLCWPPVRWDLRALLRCGTSAAAQAVQSCCQRSKAVASCHTADTYLLTPTLANPWTMGERLALCARMTACAAAVAVCCTQLMHAEAVQNCCQRSKAVAICHTTDTKLLTLTLANPWTMGERLALCASTMACAVAVVVCCTQLLHAHAVQNCCQRSKAVAVYHTTNT